MAYQPPITMNTSSKAKFNDSKMFDDIFGFGLDEPS